MLKYFFENELILFKIKASPISQWPPFVLAGGVIFASVGDHYEKGAVLKLRPWPSERIFSLYLSIKWVILVTRFVPIFRL